MYQKNKEIDQFIASMRDGELAAFVDGSVNHETKLFGSGVMLIDNKFQTREIAAKEVSTCSNSVTIAELNAALYSINYARLLKAHKITIFYDCEGVKHFAKQVKGVNNNNSELTLFSQQYKAQIDLHGASMDIQFRKVKAHTNVKYNDVADALARQAIGHKVRTPYKNKWVEKKKEREISNFIKSEFIFKI